MGNSGEDLYKARLRRRGVSHQAPVRTEYVFEQAVEERFRERTVVQGFEDVVRISGVLREVGQEGQGVGGLELGEKAGPYDAGERMCLASRKGARYAL
ncbi:MAG: hypothetical protein AAGI01_18530 [Myxococcota bacterium]